MESLFLTVLKMSLAGGVVILAVLLMRLLLRRAPRKYAYLLWLAAAFRLGGAEGFGVGRVDAVESRDIHRPLAVLDASVDVDMWTGERPASFGAGLGDEGFEAEDISGVLRADGLDGGLGQAADAEEGRSGLHGTAARGISEFARRAGAEGDIAISGGVDDDSGVNVAFTALCEECGADDAVALHDWREERGVEEDVDARFAAEVVEDELEGLIPKLPT